GQGALEEEGVGLLAGLEHAQLGVDRAVVLDAPVGEVLRAPVEGVRGLRPGLPALIRAEIGEFGVTVAAAVGDGEEGVPIEGRGHLRGSWGRTCRAGSRAPGTRWPGAGSDRARLSRSGWNGGQQGSAR